VSVACGGHAGDDASARDAIARALRHGAVVGAHPSYPDREGFGRRAMTLDPAALRGSLDAQLARFAAAARALGARAAHVKAHGALYHAANEDPALAAMLVDSAVEALGDVAVVGPPAGALREAAARAGLAFLREGFADRGLRGDGSLVPRGQPGDVLHDPDLAAAQALRLANGGALDTLCVHGDGPRAAEVAAAVRRALDGRR
jgi:UPF0271 protein